MKINFPVRSSFLADCKKAIQSNSKTLVKGSPLSIDLGPKGYPGECRVTIKKTWADSFDSDYESNDPSRLSSRIKAAARALYETGNFGQYIICHHAPRLEIRKISGTT